MNTFNTQATTVKTLLLCLITVGLFCGATAMADQAGYRTRSKTVSFSDLDLSTVQGQEIARERVHRLARTLCAQVADPTDMSHQSNYVACIDATEAKAGGSLQALVKKQSTAQFARAQ
jgi:UrcA family protein